MISRSDAKKLLLHFRRPVPRDVRDIGRWTTILSSITVIAVYANAFLIALTSDFIPRLVSDRYINRKWRKTPLTECCTGFLIL